ETNGYIFDFIYLPLLRFGTASRRFRDRLQGRFEAELGDLSDEPLDLGLGLALVEVVDAEVLMGNAVLEDVIDGGQNRGGDGADGFLRTASGLQSIELRPIVAVFLPLAGPGALHEQGLTAGRALAQAAAFAFARALVLSGTQPRDEMTGGRKAAHVAADLRNDRYRGQV